MNWLSNSSDAYPFTHPLFMQVAQVRALTKFNVPP